MVNKVILIGNLGRDPEVRTTPSGQPVATFTLATNRRWNDRQGNRQEQTEWHNIVCWGRQAEIAGQYLRKGKQIYVEGRIQTRSWDDKEGGKKNYRTEIIVENFQFGADGGARSGGALCLGFSSVGRLCHPWARPSLLNYRSFGERHPCPSVKSVVLSSRELTMPQPECDRANQARIERPTEKRHDERQLHRRQVDRAVDVTAGVLLGVAGVERAAVHERHVHGLEVAFAHVGVS